MTFEAQTQQTIRRLERKPRLTTMESNLLKVLRGSLTPNHEYAPTVTRPQQESNRTLRVVTDTNVLCSSSHSHAYDKLSSLKARYRNDPNFHIIEMHEDARQGVEITVTYTHTDDVDVLMNGGRYD